ncbi:MAG: hypothetical protein NUV57_05740 [archaeon]|nr:hypothetical protein [archaeon]
MSTEPEVIIKLKSGFLKIWEHESSGGHKVFAVIRGNKDVLRGSFLVKGNKTEFFIGSADNTKTIEAKKIIAEAVPAIKKHLRTTKQMQVHWPHTKKQNYGFAINPKPNPRTMRK